MRPLKLSRSLVAAAAHPIILCGASSQQRDRERNEPIPETADHARMLPPPCSDAISSSTRFATAESIFSISGHGRV